jgi:hypothetical protein
MIAGASVRAFTSRHEVAVIRSVKAFQGFLRGIRSALSSGLSGVCDHFCMWLLH